MIVFDRAYAARKRLVDGTHRAASLATTLARAKRVAAKVGVTRVADVTGLDTIGIPVVSAIRPNGRSLSTSQGKGVSREAAIASALMESIECWHAERVALPKTRGTYAALKARGAIDPKTLPRRRGRLDLDTPWAWVPGWDLARGVRVLVPDESVTLDCRFEQPPRLDVSSNGLASGNHVLEAITHGLCEVIERDAEARWRRARGRRRVDLSTIDPISRGLIDRCARAGAAVGVWDLTSDVGVPVFGCALVADPDEPAWRPLGVYWGFGCHLDPAIALVRALTEAAQTRVTYVAGSRDDFFPFDYDRATDEELTRAVWDDLHDRRGPWLDLRRVASRATPTFEGDLDVLLRALDHAGAARVIVCDLSHEAIGVPVVKVIVPGRARDVERMG
ncbi:MAG TPA: YcaO-like family protein [Kofleriaceae bacterium]|nr:YcaO-like family protein [Kofleriaceae bacterium]